jgi:hypothetical protein
MPRVYDEETIERGLTELVLAGGSESLAAQRLKDRGEGIPRTTLADWRNQTYASRYMETHRRLIGRLQEEMAGHAEARALEYDHAEALAIARTVETIDELPAKDAAATARNLAVGKGVAMDKARLYRDKPTIITEARPAAQILAEMAAKAAYINSDAEEIEDAQLVDGGGEPPGLPAAA